MSQLLDRGAPRAKEEALILQFLVSLALQQQNISVWAGRRLQFPLPRFSYGFSNG